ncbi:MAG: hypothetical protein WCD79_22480 [Chthoniobacteraceae bacterium]
MNVTAYCSSVCLLALFLTKSVAADSASTSPAPTQGNAATTTQLDVNDVSWLFPAPQSAADMEKLISMDTLTSGTSTEPVWPITAFNQLVTIAASNGALVQGARRINLPPEVTKDESVWRIAGIRIDPSAPGTSDDIIQKYGSAPQIRLIVQPVTVSGTSIKVNDIAVHLLYTFATGTDTSDPKGFPKILPDKQKFQQIVTDLVALKKLCADAGIPTNGIQLGVHPGLQQADRVPDLLPNLRAFLSKYLDNAHLTGMAMMGLPNDFEPWIFVALPRLPNGNFFPLPSPGLPDPTKTAQMLSFQDTPHVIPTPATNNRNPIINALFVPPPQRSGVSTAVLFQSGVDKNAAAVTGTDSTGKPITDSAVKNSDIPDIVANPNFSHFFNTDCISCHTETTRRNILSLGSGSFAFKPTSGISGLSETVRSNNQWNLRNFGWFHSTFIGPAIIPAATQRTANESAAAADFINRMYLTNPPQ